MNIQVASDIYWTPSAKIILSLLWQKTENKFVCSWSAKAISISIKIELLGLLSFIAAKILFHNCRAWRTDKSIDKSTHKSIDGVNSEVGDDSGCCGGLIELLGTVRTKSDGGYLPILRPFYNPTSHIIHSANICFQFILRLRSFCNFV